MLNRKRYLLENGYHVYAARKFSILITREIAYVPTAKIRIEMINVRKNIVCSPNGDGWLFSILVGGKAAAYHAVGKTKRKGREDAIVSLRSFLKREGVDCE